MEYGCIGEKLGHSFSAEIHAMLDSHPYELREIKREDLPAFLQEKDFRGINVTIPYKQAVIPFLDEIDPMAKEIGAVNTIVNRDGRLFGYNTDFCGLKTLLEFIGVPLAGKTVAILGTGGTSLTALAVARAMGAGEILRVSRSAGDDRISYPAFYETYAARVQILINTTPLGMYPNPDGCPADLSRFPALEAVADPIYNPLRTNLILDARERGIPAEGGLFMLCAQAVSASERFTGRSYPAETARQICADLTGRKENLILSGMPGCGKSTVGQLLAERMGRSFYDLDAEITKQVGKTPAELIRTGGEAAFRQTETEVLKQLLGKISGAVLSLGGGTILSDENVRMLRRNGKICFLDRPVSELVPTSDRPLSATQAELEKRYAERIDRYLATADLHLADFRTPEDAVAKIQENRGTL